MKCITDIVMIAAATAVMEPIGAVVTLVDIAMEGLAVEGRLR